MKERNVDYVVFVLQDLLYALLTVSVYEDAEHPGKYFIEIIYRKGGFERYHVKGPDDETIIPREEVFAYCGTEIVKDLPRSVNNERGVVYHAMREIFGDADKISVFKIDSMMQYVY